MSVEQCQALVNVQYPVVCYIFLACMCTTMGGFILLHAWRHLIAHVGLLRRALESVKKQLKEIVMLPLQRPELFMRGSLTKPVKGVLLFGPPGTGKVLEGLVGTQYRYCWGERDTMCSAFSISPVEEQVM